MKNRIFVFLVVVCALRFASAQDAVTIGGSCHFTTGSSLTVDAGVPVSMPGVIPSPSPAGGANEIWIGVRTDSLSGKGTAADPFNAGGATDAAKAAALDAVLASIPPIPRSIFNTHPAFA